MKITVRTRVHNRAYQVYTCNLEGQITDACRVEHVRPDMNQALLVLFL